MDKNIWYTFYTSDKKPVACVKGKQNSMLYESFLASTCTKKEGCVNLEFELRKEDIIFGMFNSKYRANIGNVIMLKGEGIVE